MSDLLASLVATHGWPPEPIATESLVHLLRHREARAALGELADPLVDGLTAADLDYVGQTVSPDAPGRPDIVGSLGPHVRVVIEAKFAAPLTSIQNAGDYVRHLSTGRRGLLIYLVPSDREVEMRAEAARIHSGGMVNESDSGFEIDVGDHVVTVLSWTRLLDRFKQPMADTSAAADLAQLRGLVDWLTATQWLAILPDDLTDRVGRQVAALSQAVIRAANAALTTKTTPGTSDWGPGRYLMSSGGRPFWVGIWYLPWGRHGQSPVWIAAKPTTVTHQALRAALSTKARPAFIVGDWVAAPLYLGLADEEAIVEERLQTDIAAFANELDSFGVITAGE